MFIATCHTEDCTAAGVACTVDPSLLDPATVIWCGTCGESIADVAEEPDESEGDGVGDGSAA